jgi:hypothetical protein
MGSTYCAIRERGFALLEGYGAGGGGGGGMAQSKKTQAKDGTGVPEGRHV